MSPEERQLLTGLFDRVRTAAGNPRDTEAEALIAEATKAQPYAPYLLAQTVIIQDQALNAANTRLQELEGKVRQLEAQGSSRGGGFLGGLGALFGGGAPQPSRPTGPGPQASAPWQQPRGNWQQPPQPGYAQSAPPPQQGPWGGQQGGQGGSFLKGALGTAAGVAGGVLLADSIRGLFTGHNSSPLGIGDGFGQQGGLGGETIINNYYGDDADNPGGPDAGQDPGYQSASDSDSDYGSDFGSDFGGDDGTQDI
jgi:hypothetical protein